MSKVSQLAVNDEGFVFDPATGDSYQVSHAGLFILRQLREGLDQDGIARAMYEHYEVTLEDAAADLADFLGRLRQFGMN